MKGRDIIEDLVVDVDGVERRGVLRIKRIDKTKSAFEVEYGEYRHQDSSLFAHGAVDQMRLHARFVLKRMVEEDRKGK